MSTEIQKHHESVPFTEKILEDTGVSVLRCYQCGKCSAGCPQAADMDYPPSLILRMLQTGDPELEKKVLGSFTIWLCLTCETCIARCPMEVDIPKLMDFLRTESLRRRLVHPRAKDIVRFHRSFLDSIRYTGRLFEMGLIMDYKARSRHLFQDVLLAPIMFLKGKLHIFPEVIDDRAKMQDIFAKTINKGEEER